MKKFISLAVLAVTLAGSVAFAEVAPVPAPTVKVEAKAPVAPKAKKVAKVIRNRMVGGSLSSEDTFVCAYIERFRKKL